MTQLVKDPSMQETQETQVQSLGQEEPHGEGNGNPLQYSCLENSMDREAWRATVQGVAERWTPLSPYTADSFRSSTLSGLTTDFSRAFLKNFKHSNF